MLYKFKKKKSLAKEQNENQKFKQIKIRKNLKMLIEIEK